LDDFGNGDKGAVLRLPKLCDPRQSKLSIPDPTEEAHQIAHQCVIWHTRFATDRFRNNEITDLFSDN
jgi:hypothetical protein